MIDEDFKKKYDDLKKKYDSLITNIKERQKEEERHIIHPKLSIAYQNNHNCKLEKRIMEVLLESVGEKYW